MLILNAPVTVTIAEFPILRVLKHSCFNVPMPVFVCKADIQNFIKLD